MMAKANAQQSLLTPAASERRGWLKYHSTQEIVERETKRATNEKVLKHMLESNSIEDVSLNVMFSSNLTTSPPKRGCRANNDVLARSESLDTSIQNLLEYDVEGRWSAGLNANTLLLEYRRRLLFHAYYNTQDVPEERAIAQEKLLKLLRKSYPECLSEEEILDQQREEEAQKKEEAALPKRKEKIKHELACPSPQKKTLGKSTSAPFVAKATDYDIMRMRWQVLLPQIKKLDNNGPGDAASSLTPPTRQNGLIDVPHTKVQVTGSYGDAVYLQRRAETAAARQERVKKATASRTSKSHK